MRPWKYARLEPGLAVNDSVPEGTASLHRGRARLLLVAVAHVPATRRPTASRRNESFTLACSLRSKEKTVPRGLDEWRLEAARRASAVPDRQRLWAWERSLTTGGVELSCVPRTPPWP